MKNKVTGLLEKADKKSSQKQEADAKRAMLDEIFEDMYGQRRRIYKINFVRGIFFGFGSALGGTIVIALTLWVLSIFVNIPLIGELFKGAQQTIEQRSEPQ